MDMEKKKLLECKIECKLECKLIFFIYRVSYCKPSN